MLAVQLPFQEFQLVDVPFHPAAPEKGYVGPPTRTLRETGKEVADVSRDVLYVWFAVA